MSPKDSETVHLRLLDELIKILKSSGASLNLTTVISLKLETKKQLEVYLAWVLNYLRKYEKFPSLKQYVEAMEITVRKFPAPQSET